MARFRDDDDDADRDLASALPESLTMDVALPAIVHETPHHEAAVALDEVAITPDLETVPTSTTSITIPAHIVQAMGEQSEAAALEELAATEPGIPPLPEDEAALRAAAAADATPDVEFAPWFQPRAGRKPAPEGFWQELLYGLTLHLVNLGDSAAVRARKTLDARIDKPLVGGARFIPVLSRKGGVGKTTTTLLLGMALADVRDDRVIAIDANPDRGTLADRFLTKNDSSVRDVASRARWINDVHDLTTHVARDETRLDVLSSDTDPVRSESFSEAGYNAVADVVARFYDVVLADSGTGIVQPVMRAALRRADAVVVVSGGSLDEARLASETLTWLEGNGYEHLAKNAVVALNAATQGTNLEQLDEIEAHFRARVREVVRIPYDAELGAGSVVRYSALAPFTRESARELAAVVMDGLPTERESSDATTPGTDVTPA